MFENKKSSKEKESSKEPVNLMQHSGSRPPQQSGKLSQAYYLGLSQTVGNRAVQRMVKDGSISNRQQGKSGLDMKELTEQKLTEVNDYINRGKVRQKKEVENKTGLSDELKSGLEQQSGMDLSKVRVHRNSSKPQEINAKAYAEGTDIHLAPGEEEHLPHEAWHVVQQMQGRVKPTTQVAGVPVNDSVALEKEADVMGAKAMQTNSEIGKAGHRRKVENKGRVKKGAIQREPDDRKDKMQPMVLISEANVHEVYPGIVERFKQKVANKLNGSGFKTLKIGQPVKIREYDGDSYYFVSYDCQGGEKKGWIKKTALPFKKSGSVNKGEEQVADDRSKMLFYAINKITEMVEVMINGYYNVKKNMAKDIAVNSAFQLVSPAINLLNIFPGLGSLIQNVLKQIKPKTQYVKVDDLLEKFNVKTEGKPTVISTPGGMYMKQNVSYEYGKVIEKLIEFQKTIKGQLDQMEDYSEQEKTKVINKMDEWGKLKLEIEVIMKKEGQVDIDIAIDDYSIIAQNGYEQNDYSNTYDGLSLEEEFSDISSEQNKNGVNVNMVKTNVNNQSSHSKKVTNN